YGLQTAGIFLACFIFRLNFPIAFLGSQVSIPPIYSLILPLERYVGFILLDKPFLQADNWLQTAQDHFSSWLLGAVVVGGVIAIFLGLLWYFLQTKVQKEKKVNWTGKMRGGRLGNYFVVAVLKTLGQRAGYFLLYFIIPYFYLFAPKARRGLDEYWQVIRPEHSWWKRQRQVLKQLQCFAQILMDRSIQAQKPELDYNVDISRSIDFTAATESEQPLLVLLSHLGGWGIALQGFGKKTYSQPISIIEYENQSHSTEKGIQNKQLERVKTIIVKPVEPLFMQFHDLLNKGGNLGLMGDRPFDENYELLPFFGKLVAVPTTPLRLAKIYKCRLVVLLGLKTGYKDYELIAQTFETDKEISDIAEE
ncbi:MAG: DUF2062 domain-containing protein, partial [Bdellovibrionales bacterium]|nr:DUF2062 domain-containing protein [Bdellovibrionales bacterium]